MKCLVLTTLRTQLVKILFNPTGDLFLVFLDENLQQITKSSNNTRFYKYCEYTSNKCVTFYKQVLDLLCNLVLLNAP